MNICFFLPTGRTFTFRGANIVGDNETVLVVEYTAMSDGKPKQLTMQKSGVAGWSISS